MRAVGSGRPRRMVRPPERFGDMLPSNFVLFYGGVPFVEEGPATFAEAMQRPDAEEWESLQNRVKAHRRTTSGIWERRKGSMHVIPSHGCLSLRLTRVQGTRKYKARFRCERIFVSSMEWTMTKRNLLLRVGSKSVADHPRDSCQEGYDIHQMDAISAFTQSVLPKRNICRAARRV